MRELRVLREVHQRGSREAHGQSPYGSRLGALRSQFAPFDAEAQALPVDVSALSPLISDLGVRVFMLDMSPLDGADAWA